MFKRDGIFVFELLIVVNSLGIVRPGAMFLGLTFSAPPPIPHAPYPFIL